MNLIAQEVIMDFIKKFWPFSFRIKTKDEVKPFVITLVIYVVAAIVIGIVAGLLAMIPYIGWLFSIIGYVCDLYIWAGLVFTVLRFIGVGPFKSAE